MSLLIFKIIVIFAGIFQFLKANENNPQMLHAQDENPKIFEQIIELFRQNTKSTPARIANESEVHSMIANYDCMFEKGLNYRGSMNTTSRGTACLPWDLSETINSFTHPYADLEGHNYCRNPDDDKGPWCWVDVIAGKFGFCQIPKCEKDVLSNTTPKVIVLISQRLLGSLVQVRVNSNWMSVCADHWTKRENAVFCSSLDGRVGTNTGSDLSLITQTLHIFCFGNESNLTTCRVNSSADCIIGLAKTNCSQYPVCNEEKEMLCSDRCVSLIHVCDGVSHCFNGEDEAHCEFFEVRLAGGNNRSEGRVELVINGMVGNICDDGWDDSDATVICRMLGYTSGSAVSGGEFGRGKGPIWFDDVSCKGWEEDIQLCRHAVSHDCTHFEDAGVTCHRFKNNSNINHMTTRRVPRTDNSCGLRPILQPMGRVIGGQRSAYGAFPWQARIFRRDARGKWYQQCGGTVIGEQWVVTAAHCLESHSAADYLVHLGDWRTSKLDSHEVEFKVIAIYKHPDYGQLNFWNLFFYGVNYDYDIAAMKIIRTKQSGTSVFNNYIQPVCLPTSTTNYKPGLRCEVSGWGITDAQPGSVPDTLHWATVPILSTRDCQIFYRHKMTTNMFCAGYKEGNIDTCQGDSGGPLVCLIDGYFTLLGVTSWGHGCGNENSPGIYTKVSKAVNWLNDIITHN